MKTIIAMSAFNVEPMLERTVEALPERFKEHVLPCHDSRNLVSTGEALRYSRLSRSDRLALLP